MTSQADNPERVRDAAFLLPIAASIMLLPPFILLFAAPVTIAGMPLIVLYVFAVWAAIVLCAFLLSRRLERLSAMADVSDAEDVTGSNPQSDRR